MCEFCVNINSQYVNVAYCDNMGIIIEDGKPHISMILHDEYEMECSGTSEKSIAFCPMCGRKLVEE